jgi:hypothetical protein
MRFDSSAPSIIYQETKIMPTIKVEWSTGPNFVGYYHGTEVVTIDGDAYDLGIIEKLALRNAARKLCWDGPLKKIKTTIEA